MFTVKGNVSVIRAVSFRSDRRGIPFWSIVLDWVLLCGIVAPCLLHAADENDYLRAIELETAKLELKEGTTTEGFNTGNPQRARKRQIKSTGKGLRSGLSMEGFEQQLSDNYTGSAVFYRKLSQRSQEEVYGQYQDGASMPELRSKIMKRFLNRE